MPCTGTILGHLPTRGKFRPTDSMNSAEQWEAQAHVLRNQVFRNVRVGVIYHHARVCFSAPPRVGSECQVQNRNGNPHFN